MEEVGGRGEGVGKEEVESSEDEVQHGEGNDEGEGED